MSRHFIDYTNKKLLMARSCWNVAKQHEGVGRESLRQGFLFHYCGAVSGLTAEVLQSCLVDPGQPVGFEQAERLLAEKKVLSGSFQHLKSLADDGWLSMILAEFKETQQVSCDRDNPATLHGNKLIATSEAGHLSRAGQEESDLQSLQQLIQEIRGQLQEW